MQANQVPVKLLEAWANGASSSYVRPIPVTTTTAGAASQDQGFPASTFSPLASGGTYLDGRDLQGILQMISAWVRWVEAGGPVTYDASFAAASQVGGYPKGAVVQSAVTNGLFWLCTVDGNASNPDTGGAGWAQATQPLRSLPVMLTGTGNYTVPANVTRIKVRLCGGGGGGGWANVNTFGTGGGGAGVGETVINVTPGQVLPYACGAAGAGGTSANAAGDGGSTNLGFLVAAGGKAGASSSTGGGAGAAAPTSFAIAFPGGGGQGGFQCPSGFFGGAGADCIGFGVGGTYANGNPGNPPAGYGAGGGAGGGTPTASNSGAAGAAGCIILEF